MCESDASLPMLLLVSIVAKRLFPVVIDGPQMADGGGQIWPGVVAH